MDWQYRNTALLNTLHTPMSPDCEFTAGHFSQAAELKKMDLLAEIAGLVFLSTALGMMKRHLAKQAALEKANSSCRTRKHSVLFSCDTKWCTRN